MKVTIKTLKKIIAEAAKLQNLHEEDAPAPIAGGEHKGEDSLDMQVDRFFSDYESEAKSAKTEGKDWRSHVKRLLSEEDEEEDLFDELGDEEESEDSPSGEPPKLSVDDIDISSFTNDVVRLIENFDSLIEVRNTVLRRAEKFLSKTYDESVVQTFGNDLRDNHGIEIGKTEQDSKDKFLPPPADRAGDGGAGGGAVG